MIQNDFVQADSYFQAGQLRKAIVHYRRGLRFEEDRYLRAQIYLKITRIYRIMVRMKNARLEILRAFDCIGLQAPTNSLFSLLRSVGHHGNTKVLHPDFLKNPRTEQIHLLADLYEELGLSAYYLRQNIILLQSILNSKRFCEELGPSVPLMNWYGGAACVYALLKQERKALGLIKKCHNVSQQLQEHASMGKALIWKALLYDYLGEPVRSAELFRQCLQEFGKDLGPFDLRLAVLTLSTNLFYRGHFEEALDTLTKLKLNPCFQARKDSWLDDAFWYYLGPSAMLGQTERIQQILSQFRSILGADKDEKWLLTKYLGHLFTAERIIHIPDFQSQDLVRRFELLEMKPHETHFESSFYWVAEAYLRFEQAQSDPKKIKILKVSLRNLRKTPRHPSTQAHYALLRAALAALEKQKNVYQKWSERAINISRRIDNRWVFQELDNLNKKFNMWEV